MKKEQLSMVIVITIILSIVYSNCQNLTPREARILQDFSNSTTRQRTQNSKQFCPNGRTLVQTKQQEDNINFRSIVSSQLNIDGNKLVKLYINRRFQQGNKQLQNHTSELVRFFGAFVVGLVLILFIWPFLLCCCCCCSRCCKNGSKVPYTSNELCCPTIFIIIACLFIFAAAITGFVYSTDSSRVTQNIFCAVSIAFDDIINGNVTTNGKDLFIGVNTLDSRLTNLTQDINSINSALDPVKQGGTIMNQANTRADNALQSISQIPNGLQNGSLTLTYNTPLNVTVTLSTINSLFPRILGSQTTQNSLVFGSYTILNGSKAILNQIAQAATNFGNQIGNYQSSISDVQDQVQSFNNLLIDYDSQTGNYMRQAKRYSPTAVLVTKILYGLIIGCAICIIFGAILMTWKEMYIWRYLMYFGCALLYIIGIVGFLLALLYTAVLFASQMSCEFLETSFQSESNFNSNFQGLIDSRYRVYVSVCLPTSNGSIISVIGPGISASIANLSTAITNLNNFSSLNQTNSIGNGFSLVQTSVLNYRTARTNDIDDTSSLSVLSNIASRNGYNCLTNGWGSDSWVPSNLQTTPEYVSCSVNDGNSANSTQCTTANLPTPGSSCSGCLDTYDIFKGQVSRLNVESALNNRYPGAGCNIFNSELSNVWNNFYLVKRDTIGGVLTRTNDARTDIDSFIGYLNADVNNTFTSVLTSLSSNFDSITNPTTGLIAGLNCRLVGQDLVTIQNSYCTTFYNYIYLNRLVMIVYSFGILFASCFIVTSGFRHFEQQEILKQQKAYGAVKGQSATNLR